MMNWRNGKPYDYELVQAMWTLGRFPPERLPDVAAEAMVGGSDSPAVLELASFHWPHLDGISGAVEPAFLAMGLPPMSRSRAGWLYARLTARLVVHGVVDLLRGCKEICSVWRNDPEATETRELVTIYGLVDEYEEHPRSWEAYRKPLLEEVRALAAQADPPA